VLARNYLSSSVFNDCSRLVTLQILDLSSNQIDKVPPSVAFLVQIVDLNLDDNTIECIPHEVGALKKLKILSLRNNQVQGDMVASTGYQSLPEELFAGTCLERLNLEGNPILRRELNEFKGVDMWLDRQSKTKQKDLALYMT